MQATKIKHTTEAIIEIMQTTEITQQAEAIIDTMQIEILEKMISEVVIIELNIIRSL